MLRTKNIMPQDEAKQAEINAKKEQKMREMAKLAAEAKAREKKEAYDAQHKKFIECDHCYKMKNDEDGKACRFSTNGEKRFFAMVDATGWCGSCKQVCRVCRFPNSFNPARKLMFCSPLCWISYRGGVHGIAFEKKTYWLMMNWCDDNMSSAWSLGTKNEIKRMYLQ